MVSNLRIAHIDTERPWRGGENQVLLLMKGLRTRGHTNIAVVRANSVLADRAQAAGFTTKDVCPYGEWDFISAHFLNRWLKREKIDVVHAHSSHGAALASLGTLGTKIPVIITRRVDFPLSKNIFSRWKYNRAEKIVAISEGVKGILVKSGIPEEKIQLVPSGVDFSQYKDVKKALAPEMGLPENCRILGQVAALAPHKDQATFIRAFALLQKKDTALHAVIVGEGELRSSLEKLAIQLGIEKSVHLLGFKKDPLRFVSAFNVFCLSSSEEGLGTSLLDAMALRIPVVATKVGGIPELIQDSNTGFLAEPKSPEQLAAKIEKALMIRSTDPALIDRALEHARKYDVQTTVQKTELVYFQSLVR